MKPFPSSNRGVETAPMYVAFSAFVMVLTAGIVYPALMEFQDNMKIGKAMKEMRRLGATIDEVCTIGDAGTVTRIDLDIPEPFYIKVHPDRLILRKDYGDGKAEGDSFEESELKLKSEIGDKMIKQGAADQNWITGKYQVILLCYDESFSDPKIEEGQIFVKNK
jgi:hypothetical protein